MLIIVSIEQTGSGIYQKMTKKKKMLVLSARAVIFVYSRGDYLSIITESQEQFQFFEIV